MNALCPKNGFTEFKEIGDSFYKVLPTFNGTVTWKAYQCSIDVTYFAFDKHICDIQFTLWSHYNYQFTLSSSSDSLEMGNIKTTKA